MKQNFEDWKAGGEGVGGVVTKKSEFSIKSKERQDAIWFATQTTHHHYHLPLENEVKM